MPVFLLDQNQVARPGEMGTVQAIGEYAESLGMDVHEIDLDDQFRCGASALYVEWVERLPGVAPGGPFVWEGDGTFQVEVVDSPDELEHVLALRQEDGYTARMATTPGSSSGRA